MKYPSLAIFVSIWNEPEELLLQNKKIFGKIKYSGNHQVYWILHHKDKKTIELAERIKGKKIKLIISPENTPLKAVGINYAIPKLKEQVIVSFDIDNIPSKDYFNVGVKELMTNKGVGLTIGGEEATNKDQSVLTAVQDLEQKELFFAIKNMVRIKSGGYIPVAGAGYFIRKNDLMKMGGLAVNTVTEDADLTIRLLNAGLKGIVIPEVLGIEVSNNIFQVIKQRIRWRKGVFQLFKEHRNLQKKNLTIYRTYVWTLMAPLLTFFKLIKYPLAIILTPLSPALGITTFVAMLLSDLEGNHWEIQKRQGPTSRKITYAYMAVDIVYMLVLILAFIEYKISPMKWHLTKKRGREKC